MVKKISYLFIIFTLFIGFNFSVNAETNYTVDFERKGSIDITLHETIKDSYVEGAEITIYHVADIYNKNSNLAHKFTEQFSGCEVSLEDINKDGLHKELESCITEETTGICTIKVSIIEYPSTLLVCLTKYKPKGNSSNTTLPFSSV